MNKYIDTHGHIISKYVDKDEANKLLAAALEMGVQKIILPGTDPKDSMDIIEYADGVHTYATAGVHPGYVNEDSCIDFFKDVDFSKVVAIGEIGLDYFHDDYASREQQQKMFIAQLRIAMKENLPVIIHSREATEDTYKILCMEEFKGLKFVMHSYAGGVEWLDKFNALDAYYSFNGITTFKNAHANKEAAKAAPLNRIVSETDSPYLTPVPHRGEVNQPAFVKHVADYVAEIRSEEDQVVLEALWDNALELFNIKN